MFNSRYAAQSENLVLVGCPLGATRFTILACDFRLSAARAYRVPFCRSPPL